MDSRTITLNQLAEEPERFFNEAENKHIKISDNGVPKRVLIDISEWERLTGKKDTRRAYSIGDGVPEELSEALEGEW